MCALGALVERAEAVPTSNVILNGVATPVFYNDGDTFRALAGKHAQTPARLGGFNTLESYGPVHQWKGWTFKELYVNAKQATLNARRGIWSCKADPSNRDGYGRMLAECLDLATDQIKKGLAHAYNIGGPAHPQLIAAQRYAITHRKGMWAKGAPALVMTSLHSADERLDNKDNYNRLISSVDGQSTKWKHQNTYRECEKVCHRVKELSREAARHVLSRLRKNERTSRIIRGYEDPYLIVLLNEFVQTGRVAEIFGKGDVVALGAELKRMQKAGDFGELVDTEGSCMIYVVFERRYKAKPDCLKW